VLSITATATDAAGNTSGASGTLNITIENLAPANPPGGTYNTAQSVSLITAGSGAQIRYTTIGNVPTARSRSLADQGRPEEITASEPLAVAEFTRP
jgi:hypothetical protein